MKRKILLTGSSGFLGTKFIELYGGQYKIMGVSRSDPLTPVDLLDFANIKNTFKKFMPDIVIHTAADLGRDSNPASNILKTNPAITNNLVELARLNNTPFIFTSTEAVYGGKEHDGEYEETDPYHPRSSYGASKVESEKIIKSSGLPYLITRGHRYVGVSKYFNKPKQFPDTLQDLKSGNPVHLDARKLFKPVLIDHICNIFAHYIKHDHDTDKRIILNLGVDKATTYYDFILDVSNELDFDLNLLKPDGNEIGWPLNSTLSLKKLQQSDYPTMSYPQVLETIKKER